MNLKSEMKLIPNQNQNLKVASLIDHAGGDIQLTDIIAWNIVLACADTDRNMWHEPEPITFESIESSRSGGWIIYNTETDYWTDPFDKCGKGKNNLIKYLKIIEND